MRTPEYSVTILRHIEGADVAEIVDKYITAEDTIELMIYIRDNIHGPQEETQEQEEVEIVEYPEPTPKPKTKAKDGQKRSVCGNCGRTGHNRKTCGTFNGEALQKAPKPKPEAVQEEDSDDVIELKRMITEEPKLSVSGLQLMFPNIELYRIVATREEALKNI